MSLQIIKPLKTRHILAGSWISPAKTLAVGSILGFLCMYLTPVYAMTYVSILIPICILTAITQLSISIIKEIEQHKTAIRENQ